MEMSEADGNTEKNMFQAAHQRTFLFVCYFFFQFEAQAFTDLVRAADQVEVVFGEELGDDVVPEGVADASKVGAPAARFGVWVGPQQVAQQPFVCHLRARGGRETRASD